MSTILEALRKSEQERKRNDVPKLTDVPPPQETTRWALYVIAVLSLVLALVLGVLLSQWLGKSETTTPAASTLESVTETEVASPELTADPVVALKDVQINVISYSEKSEQRFVMIDGKMYRENDFVRAGLKVQEIKANVVVLNYRGELINRTP